MPQYIRAFVPAGTFFFTVTLLERRRKLLTETCLSFHDTWNATFTTQSINFDAFQAAAYRTCFSRKYLCTTWGCI
jgi:REP element-mobilizing transposase RayT